MNKKSATQRPQTVGGNVVGLKPGFTRIRSPQALTSASRSDQISANREKHI